MHIKSFGPVAGVLVIVSCTSRASAQMSLISSERHAWAWQNWDFDVREDLQSDSGFDEVFLQASVPQARAQLRSSITESTVSFDALVQGYGGAGHHAAARCLVDLIFEVAEPTRWSIYFTSNPFPFSPEYDMRLSPADDTSINLFREINWYDPWGGPVAAEGFMTSGRYRLLLMMVVADGPTGMEYLTFTTAVPAPSTLIFMTPGLLAWRHVRRAR